MAPLLVWTSKDSSDSLSNLPGFSIQAITRTQLPEFMCTLRRTLALLLEAGEAVYRDATELLTRSLSFKTGWVVSKVVLVPMCCESSWFRRLYVGSSSYCVSLALKFATSAYANCSREMHEQFLLVRCPWYSIIAQTPYGPGNEHMYDYKEQRDSRFKKFL